MADIKLEIKKRNRDYGILTWSLRDDFEIKTLFELQEKISIGTHDKFKLVKVSYKYRRLSIGKKILEKQLDKQFIVLSKLSSGSILIKFE